MDPEGGRRQREPREEGAPAMLMEKWLRAAAR